VNAVYDIFFIIIKYSYLFHLNDLSPLCYPAYEAARIDPKNKYVEQISVFYVALY